MDECPFSYQLKGVDVDQGTQEMHALFKEAGVQHVRTTVDRKGRGGSMYDEVTVTADEAIMKWWAPTGRNRAKGGTVMIEGSERLYLKLTECLMWKSRLWARTRRLYSILVTDDKLKRPSERKKMYIVVVSDDPSEQHRRTKILNGYYGEEEWEAWRKTGAIAMGFLTLAKATEWQEDRAGEEQW